MIEYGINEARKTIKEKENYTKIVNKGGGERD